MTRRSKRGSGTRHRAVSIQIRVKVHRPLKLKLTKAFLADAVRYRIQNGEDLPGIEITGIVWEKADKAYRYEDENAITRALEAAGRMFKFDPSVFHPVREG